METVLVTGANRGLGREFVRQYADDGWRVFACCREPTHAAELDKLASQHDGRVTLHQLDVQNHTQIDSLAKELDGEAIDVLINNAGAMVQFESFADTDYERWARVMDINAFAPFKISIAFLEHVARSNRKIITAVSSNLGSIELAEGEGWHVYRSSKTALNMVMKVLTTAVAERGIKTALLSPGWCATDMGRESLGEGQDASMLVDPKDSVAGLRSIIDDITPENSGQFIHYDRSSRPW